MEQLLQNQLLIALTEQQKTIIDASAQTHTSSACLYYCWSVVSAAVISPLDVELPVKQLFNIHEALKTTFEPAENSLYPVQKITDEITEDQYIIQCMDAAQSPIVFSEYCTDTFKDKNAGKAVFVIAPRHDEQGHLLYLQLPAELADMHSLLKIAESIEQRIYHNQEPTQPAIRYSQYASWQQDTLDNIPQEVANWMRIKQAGAATTLPLQLAQNNNKAVYHTLVLNQLPATVQRQISHLSLNFNVAVSDIWLSVFVSLLHHLTGNEIITTGFNLTGRVYDELQETIGRIDQICPLSVSWLDTADTRSLAQLIKKNREDQLAVAEYINRAFLKKLSPSGNPYVLQYLTLSEKSGRYINHQNVQPTTQLQLNVIESGTDIFTSFTYNSSSFTTEAITQLQTILTALLQGLLNEPEQSITQKATLAIKNAVPQVVKNVPVKWETFIDAFEKQCLLTPNSVAVEHINERLSYEQVNKKSYQFAQYLLTKQDIKPGDIVAVSTSRSQQLIVAVLAILKAGAIFLPIDTSLPALRTAAILDDASPKLFLTSQNIDLQRTKQLNLNEAFKLAGKTQATVQLPIVKAGMAAYIIYTSGTTGVPKGCIISHANFAHYISWCTESYFAQSNSVNFAWFTPLSFDLTITSIFSPLAIGGQVTIIADELDINQALQQSFIGTAGINTVKLTPSHIDVLQTLNIDQSPVKVVITGGEPLYNHQVKALLNLNPQMDIYNEYGPTEATVGCIVKKVNNANEHITVGKAINRMQTYILDANQRQLLPGISGELYLAGDGIAMGYLNKLPLTAEKFIPAAWDTNIILYRTGDIARLLPNGEIDFLGRADNQVKIRGYRIELAEIIHHLKNITQVTGAYVLVEQKDNEKRLLAFYCSDNNDINNLRDLLLVNLPPYMLPDQFFRVTEIPLTVNGKVNEHKLLTHELTLNHKQSLYEAPSSHTEQVIATAWAEVLKIEKISRTDDFFKLGGQSIKAAQLVGRLKKALQVDFQLKDIFNNPVLSEQALLISNLQAVIQNAPQLLPQQSNYEASASQSGIWTAQHMQLKSAAYNMPAAYIINGNLNKEAFIEAFNQLTEQYESLRTSFTVTNNGLRQVIHEKAPFEYLFEDWSAQDISDELINQASTTHALQYIDPSQWPLYRTALYKLKNNRWLLLFNIHHIICDGQSAEILFANLKNYYQQLSAGSAAVPFTASAYQYKEFAAWQNKLQSNEQQNSSKAYWMQQLQGDLPKCTVIAPGKQNINRQYKSAAHVKVFDKDITAHLQSFAQQKQTGLSAIVIAMVEMVLYRYSGQQEWAIGVPVDTRQDEVFENQIGFFLNTMVLRNTIDVHKSADDLIDQIRNLLLEGLKHKHYPFELLNNDLRINNDGTVYSLFNILVNFQESGNHTDFEVSGLSFKKLPAVVTDSKVDIAFNFSLIDGLLHLELDYSTDLYTAQFIEQLTGHLHNIATKLTAHSNQTVAEIPMLTASEIKQINAWQYTQVNWGNKHQTIWDIFAGTVQKYPDQIAVIFENASITYLDLKLQAEELSKYFTYCLQIKTGQIVPVIADRNQNTIKVLLALLRCGAVYLPVESNYPQQRIEAILTEADASVVLNTSSKTSLVTGAINISSITLQQLNQFSGQSLPPLSLASAQAYMIFTSGSTGRPKGVMITHDAFINMITAQLHGFEITHADKCLWFSSPGFDASLSEIFLALLSGSTLCIASRELIQNQYHFLSWLKEQQITVGTIPPAYLAALPQDELLGFRILISAGEALVPALALRFAQKNRLFNAYGPTENAVCTTFYEVQPVDTGLQIPIGKPIANVKVKVLDVNGQQVPAGIPGQLHIGGMGLTEGYYKNEQQTTLHFYDEDNEHWYQSGDWVRWLNNGTLVYLGRNDEQIKIRGNRVELGDIKEFILKTPHIKNAVVIYKSFANMGPFLVAYLVLQSDQQLNTQDLKQTLLHGLPDYMVPDHFIVVDDIPLNSNAKVDISKLPSPVLTSDGKSNAKTGITHEEELLIKSWQMILKNDAIDAESNFFNVGGQSLQAIQIISDVYRQTQVNITLSDIYTYPKLSDLAQLLATKIAQGTDLQTQQQHTNPQLWAPSTPMQQKLWADMDLSNGHKYLMSGTLLLNGELNNTLFLKSLSLTLEQYPALRYRFSLNENGLGFNTVDLDVGQVIYQDLSAGNDVEADIDQFIKLTLLAPVNPEKDPLCRLALLKTGQHDWQFMFMLHHLVGDAWSVRLLFTTVLKNYEQLLVNDQSLLPVTNNYADYSLWVSAHPPKAVNRKALAATCLLKDTIQVNRTGNVQSLQYQFKPEIYEALKQLSKAYSVSYLPLINSLQMLSLAQHTGQQVLSVLTPLHGHYQTKWENTLGLFMNLVPFTVTTDFTSPVSSLITDIQQQYMKFVDPENIADYVAQWVPSAFDLGKDKALVEIQLDDFDLYYDEDVTETNIPNLTISGSKRDDEFMVRKFDLEFHYKLSKNEFSVQCMFNADLFLQANIKPHLSRFENMLLILSQEPHITLSELTMALTSSEKDKMQADQSNRLKDFFKKN